MKQQRQSLRPTSQQLFSAKKKKEKEDSDSYTETAAKSVYPQSMPERRPVATGRRSGTLPPLRHMEKTAADSPPYMATSDLRLPGKFIIIIVIIISLLSHMSNARVYNI